MIWNFAQATDGSVRRISRLPRKLRSLAATDRIGLGRELSRNGSDRNGGAGDPSVESWLWRHVQAFLPIHGFRGTVVIQVHNYFLPRFRVDRPRPHGVSFARYRDLIGSRFDKQALMPDPIPIEFIDMADKIRRS